MATICDGGGVKGRRINWFCRLYRFLSMLETKDWYRD
jgi:hypothetical protein